MKSRNQKVLDVLLLPVSGTGIFKGVPLYPKLARPDGPAHSRNFTILCVGTGAGGIALLVLGSNLICRFKLQQFQQLNVPAGAVPSIVEVCMVLSISLIGYAE